MNQLPTIKSYGEYHGQNYGLNCLKVSFSSGLVLYYSYDTIIAFGGRDGLKVRKNEWSTTTGKHLNWIDGGDKSFRLDGKEFEALLLEELEHYGLVSSKESTDDCGNCGREATYNLNGVHRCDRCAGL